MCSAAQAGLPHQQCESTLKVGGQSFLCARCVNSCIIERAGHPRCNVCSFNMASGVVAAQDSGQGSVREVKFYTFVCHMCEGPYVRQQQGVATIREVGAHQPHPKCVIIPAGACECENCGRREELCGITSKGAYWTKERNEEPLWKCEACLRETLIHLAGRPKCYSCFEEKFLVIGAPGGNIWRMGMSPYERTFTCMPCLLARREESAQLTRTSSVAAARNTCDSEERVWIRQFDDSPPEGSEARSRHA